MGKKLTIKLGISSFMYQFIAVIMSFMSVGLLLLLDGLGNASKVIVGIMDFLVLLAPLCMNIWSEGWSDVNKNKLYKLKNNPFKGVIAVAFPVLPGLLAAAVNLAVKSDVIYMVLYFYNFYLMPFVTLFPKNYTANFVITLISALVLFAGAYLSYYFGIRQRSPIHEIMYGKGGQPKRKESKSFLNKKR